MGYYTAIKKNHYYRQQEWTARQKRSHTGRVHLHSNRGKINHNDKSHNSGFRGWWGEGRKAVKTDQDGDKGAYQRMLKMFSTLIWRVVTEYVYVHVHTCVGKLTCKKFKCCLRSVYFLYVHYTSITFFLDNKRFF